MLLPHLPEYGNTQWQEFVPSQDATNTRGWQTWLKPLGKSWIYIIACGPGGGGAGGGSTAATARTGGGGGGSGALNRYLIPAFLFPDVIYIRPGAGGGGGAAATDGGTPLDTLVALAADPTTFQVRLAVGTAGAPGLAANTAGGGGSASTSQSFNAWGMFSTTSGQTGGAGGVNTGAVGVSISPSSSLVLTGGAGGASSSSANSVSAGGAINAASGTSGPSLWKAVPAGAAGVSGTTAGGNGTAGQNHGGDIASVFSRNQPLLFSGGSGGGSGGASNGGVGGPGAWGCGGGGGGAGATGGAGGKGGDGFVIIGAF